ncbi:hypothetical protein V6N13_028288 [Hibiscus sabdariffa]
MNTPTTNSTDTVPLHTSTRAAERKTQIPIAKACTCTQAQKSVLEYKEYWYEGCLFHIALDFIRFDNKLAFVRWTRYQAESVGGYDVYQSLMLPRIAWTVSVHDAVKCATALLQGETCLKLDTHEVLVWNFSFSGLKEVIDSSFRYAKDGKLVEIATLLTVAPENVTSPSLFKGLHDPALDGSMSLRRLALSEIV